MDINDHIISESWKSSEFENVFVSFLYVVQTIKMNFSAEFCCGGLDEGQG